MKKTLRTLFMGMMALLAGTALTSCSNDDELQTAPEGQKGYVEFSLSRGADTRTAHSFSKTGLAMTWSEGDKVVVFYGGSTGIAEVFDMVSGAGTKTATFAKEDSKLADKSGDIEIVYRPNFDGSKSYSENIFDFSKQDGTLENLGKYDYLLFYATLTNGKINYDEISFHAAMSILRFPTDIDFGTGTTTADFVFSGGGNKQALYSAPTLGDITVENVSLTNGKLSQDLYIAVWGDISPNTLKVGDKTFVIPNELDNGKVYTFAQENLREVDTTPLTIEALDDGTITIQNQLGLKISYKKNSNELVTSTSNITIPVSAGDKVQLFGDNAAYGERKVDGQAVTYKATNITCNGRNKVYGNIMSLVDSDGYATATTLQDSYNFYYLFANNTGLTDASDLILPATALTKSCYHLLFFNCMGLTAAPTLPASTLAEGCYDSMFRNCVNLTTAPILPATTLENSCYRMMFSGCTSLNDVTCLATDISADDCISDWLSGVASTGTFTKAASMTNWSSGTSGIPSGWTEDNYTE